VACQQFGFLERYDVLAAARSGATLLLNAPYAPEQLWDELPREKAIAKIKSAVQKTYGKKGVELVERNFAAIDAALAHLHEISIPGAVTSQRELIPPVTPDAPDFVQRVTAAMITGHGDDLSVSAFPPDGTWPTGTSRYEKRNIAAEIPAWDSKLCIQCNKCALFCPHAAIRPKAYEPAALAGASESFRSTDMKSAEFSG